MLHGHTVMVEMCYGIEFMFCCIVIQEMRSNHSA